MESSNRETVAPAEPEKAEQPVIVPLIMVESDDDSAVCDVDGTCY
ncbi:hypothetical protein GCM10010172_38470 [Paractinoplanes ferrugineus]|uniref:Uncharacterized protein n=1 Tax=Paractinoplanes ferrugineus TaxID=113564 RepID=A0A919J2B8_9ACTN|nr:hypothetical protein [Actinoplanes ferrugineus]GIE12623.1 hypothetical protein Afe05nite_44630 [Actinoplanes ferrugineus]